MGGDRVFTRFYDPKIISGWGNRAYNWELGVSVQQEAHDSRVVEPFQTDIRGLATYTIPRIDVQVSGTWRSNPGADLRRTSS